MSSTLDRIRQRKQELREGERIGSSSTNSQERILTTSDKINKLKLEKQIGFDSFEADLNNTNDIVNSVYSEWQTERRLGNNRDAISNMQDRLNAYQEYQKLYGDGTAPDVSDIIGGYNSVLDDWDNISNMHSYYQSADAFNNAMTKAKYDNDENFQGLTYDEVQEMLTQYEEGSDEYNYLSHYTNYSSLEDFDKALGALAPTHETSGDIQGGFIGFTDLLNDTADGERDEEGAYRKELLSLRNQYALEHESEEYMHLMENEDFAEKSKYESTVENNKIFGFIDNESQDDTYEYVNNVNGAREDILAEHDKYQAQSQGGIYTPSKYVEMGLDAMTDDEIAIYNYIYATKGSDEAYEYLEDIETTLTKRISDNQSASLKEEMDNNPLVGGLLNVVSPALSVGGGLYGSIENVSSALKGEVGNPYSIYNDMSNTASIIRDETSKDIAEMTEGAEIFGVNVPSFLYNTGMSMADSYLGMVSLGKGFTPLMGSNAYQQTTKELMEAGASEDEIKTLATISGLAEAGWEYVGVDNLFKIKNTDELTKIVTNGLKQAGAEAGEELGTEFTNVLADTMVRGWTSEYGQMYTDLIEQGYSEAEAMSKVSSDFVVRMAQAGAGGFLSGGVMGTVYSGNQYHDLSNMGATIRGNDRVGDVMGMFTPEEADTYKLYSEYANKGVTADNIKDAQLGNLYATKEGNAIDTYNSRKATTEQKTNALRTLDALHTYKNTPNTKIKATGQNVDIEGVKTVEGEKVLVTSNGELSAKDVELSANDTELLAYAEGMSEEKANLFIAQYDGTSDVEAYKNSFDMAYAYGVGSFDADIVLKNRGILTEAQASEIYKSAITDKVKAQQKAVDEVNAKYGKTVTVAGTFNDSIIDYNNATTDGSKVNWNSLTTRQRDAITFARGFSEATGVNITFIKSDVVNGKRVGKNGSYNHKTNTIELDVYAGRIDASSLNDSIIPTLSHEITHWMKAKSPAMYHKMQEYIAETLTKDGKNTFNDLVADEKKAIKKRHPEIDVTDELAIDEIVARACEDMLSNSDTARKMLNNMTKKEQNSFVAKVKETFDNLMKWVNELLAKYKSTSKEAEVLRQYKDRLKQLSKMWDKALAEAVQTNQSLQQEGINGEKLVNGISEDGTTIIGQNAIQMSERTYEDGGREYLKSWLAKKVKSKGISQEDANDIIKQTDAIYDLMQEIKAGNELPDYARWAEQDITTDENGKKISVIVKNGDYSMNLDISLVCKKRTALNAVLNAMVQSNDLSIYTLTETDVAKLNAIIKEHEFEIACALCFVDSKRYRVGSWADSFCEGTETKEGKKYGFNEMVRSLVPKGSNLQIDEFNFTGRNIIGQPTSNLLKDADDSELDFTLIDKIMKDNPPASNGAKSAQYRYAEAIKAHKELRSILNPSEIISSIGLDAIRVENTLLYGLINGHQGTAKPKFAHNSVAFKNDILKASSWTPEKAKMVGGVRLQSFSDFMANMVFDYVQMISEMSAKKLPAHAYTKEPLFVRLFGLTGMKINMSLVPKVALTEEQKERFKKMSDAEKEKDEEYQRLKETAGLTINENGEVEYDWEDETFPYEVAMEIMADKRYTPNCGTIAVGISKAHINKLLADDRISMVIPYHKSGLNHMVAEMRNIALYNDYTNVQNTRYASGEKLDTKKHKDFNFYGDLYGSKTKQGTGDPRKTAQNYLDWCDKNNYLPKFDEFRGDKNYYKLLIDFSVYDINNNMQYTEQGAVKPIYPSNEEFKDWIVNGVVHNGITYGGLKQSQETSEKLDKETEAIVDEFRKVLTEEHGKDVLGTQYSDRDIDSWLDDLSIEELMAIDILEDDEMFLDDFSLADLGEDEMPQKKVRAKRRVDEVNKRLKEIGLSFNGTKSLAWTDERIDKYLSGGWYGASNPKYAQAYIAYITPQQFLNLTVGGKNATLDMIERESAEYGAVDIERLGNSDPQYLEIKEGRVWSQVTDHDGRHRMYLLGKAGFEKVPVLLFDHRTKYDKTAKAEMKLIAQKSNYDALVSKSRNTVIEDVIPFSQGNRDLIIEKFGSGKDADIHYSERDNVSIYDLMGENKSLQKQNTKLEEDVNRLKERLKLEKQVTHGNTFNANQLQSVAKHLRKSANSTYAEDALVEELKDVYSYIVTAPQIDWTDLMAKCYEVARNVLNESKGYKVTNDYFKSVLEDIRRARITLSEEQIQEAKSAYGEKYRDAFMGRVMLVKNGTSLDQKWQEWASMYPEIFDENVTGGDQITALSDIYDALREGSENYQQFNDAESIRAFALEIYNQYWNVSTIRTTADKYDKQIKKLNFEHRSAMNELRSDYKKRVEDQKKADAIHYGKMVRDIRQRKDTDVKRAKEAGKQRLADYKDRVERNAKIDSITNKALTLNKWLTKNSKDEHIPEVMKAPVAYLLDAIDFSSKQLLGMRGGIYAGMPTRKDISLSKALEQVHDMVQKINSAQIGEDEIAEIYGTFADFPMGFADDIRTLSGTVNDIMRSVGDNAYVLNQMSLEELESLDAIISIMKSTVTKMNKFLAIRHAEGVANMSQKSILYLDSLGKAKERGKMGSTIEKMLDWGNALPFYTFKRFGEGGQKVYEALQDGWDKFAFHIKDIIDYSKATYNSKEVQEWGETVREFNILEPATDAEKQDPNYKPRYQKIQMSVPQVMSLYCLQKREQARGHLIGGGMRISDIKIKDKTITQSEGVILSESEIDAIIGTLTKRQRDVADALQRFMNTTCTDWGNEVSMLRFGYKAFGEENYFPIQSDKNNLAVNDETEQNNSLFRLLNMSFTKGTIRKANNRIVVSDIFDVFAQHSSDMAKYNALALPVLDAFKWYNYKEKAKKGDTQFATKSLKQSLENAFGKDAQNYIVTFLRDINGEQSAGRDVVGKGFATNAKLASVGFNMRVVALQPTSYVRASAVIDNKYLAKAFLHKPKIAKAQKHCGIALWKAFGFYDINVQNNVTDLIKHNKTMRDKVVDASMKGAEIADKITWGYLWNACELEVRDKQKNLKVGSEEFYKAVSDRLREVIYSTQVVDSTMTRSHMMRSTDRWDKMATAFMSEPTLSYNMLQDCYMDWKLTERQTGSKKDAFKKHGKRMARVFTAYTVTNMISALIEAGFDIFRDDEEEITPEEFIELYLKNLASNMNIINNIPYAKEVVSMMEGYSSSRTDTQWMQYFTYTITGAGKLLEGEGNAYTTAKNAMRAFSYFTGIPLYNVWRDSTALLDKTSFLETEELEEMFNETIGAIFPSLKSK